jgi:excinuclease UvrABC nuclease subunit
MPWAGTKVWPFTKNGILVNTPNASGVYALWTGETLVYVGESNDILRRLLELFRSPRPCIAKYWRLVFGYELVPTEARRVERQDRLIRELLPACNQPLG